MPLPASPGLATPGRASATLSPKARPPGASRGRCADADASTFRAWFQVPPTAAGTRVRSDHHPQRLLGGATRACAEREPSGGRNMWRPVSPLRPGSALPPRRRQPPVRAPRVPEPESLRTSGCLVRALSGTLSPRTSGLFRSPPQLSDTLPSRLRFRPPDLVGDARRHSGPGRSSPAHPEPPGPPRRPPQRGAFAQGSCGPAALASEPRAPCPSPGCPADPALPMPCQIPDCSTVCPVPYAP